MKFACLRLTIVFLVSLVAGHAEESALVSSGTSPGDFALVSQQAAAPFLIESGTAASVARAADDLRSDLERVGGVRPGLQHELSSPAPRILVVAGVVGESPLLRRLAADGKIDVRALSGAWESFVITIVSHPWPGVDQALVIAGSDARGAIYGLYELSEAIGVSPWYWWADVTPKKNPELRVAAGTRRFGPPSVKYRGIFINDEDWGLHPWAAKTFEPEHGGIGPKTYAKVFELLLRLKANTLWPAMHAVSQPFNRFAENAPLADAYGIVMGSSHAEPMLRNNVGEWKDEPGRYNYLTNRDGVLKYWEERVVANGRYENIYTLGMRGIHDSMMQGPKTDAERISTLEQIFGDQRALLAKHVRPDLARVPQIFCAYKEVLPLYRGGLRVPDDVTVVFPDDNFGYIRDYPSAAERGRAGGFGVYYHLSYLGAPLSYLWLSTLPPALIWEEMTKAYDAGAQTIWIANVGDIKPGEIDTEFFLQVAWDVHRWRRENLPDFLVGWAAREFGAGVAREVAAIMAGYYQLNYQRKPEHLQWWMPKEAPRSSPVSASEAKTRIQAFADLASHVAAVREKIPASESDAFFELVEYPVRGAQLANNRFFAGEFGVAEAAANADRELQELTAFYNERIAGAKWRGILALEPADEQWKSMRLAPWVMPKYLRPILPASNPSEVISIEAEHFTRKTSAHGAAWEIVPGLGRTGEGSVTVFPTTIASVTPEKLTTDAPHLDYALNFAKAGEFPVTIYLVPAQPLAGSALRFALALDDASPQVVALEFKDGSPEWAHGVLDATRRAEAKITVPAAGAHTLKLYMVDPGVVIDKIVIDEGGLQPSYLGPLETR